MAAAATILSGRELPYHHFSVKPEDAAPESLPSQPSVTPISPLAELSSFSCDFEDGSRPTCNFVEDGEGTWKQVIASDPPTSYNPIADNTLKNSKCERFFCTYSSYQVTLMI